MGATRSSECCPVTKCPVTQEADTCSEQQLIHEGHSEETPEVRPEWGRGVGCQGRHGEELFKQRKGTREYSELGRGVENSRSVDGAW